MEKDFLKPLGFPGRMISGSKSGYHKKYPKNCVVFNANLCTENEKIWYGDLDLALDKELLSDITKDAGIDLYVLYEMDARFDTEENFNLEKAVAIFHKDGTYEVGEKWREYVNSKFLLKRS